MLQKDKSTHEKSPDNEVETLIELTKSGSFVKCVKFRSDSYIAVNYRNSMLQDLIRCVHGNSTLNVDTTFNLVPRLWLTDTSYKHLGLIDSNGKHPEFPGPSMWYFKKDRMEFRNFATEFLIECPDLKDIKLIGHDLDKPTALGFKDVFSNAEHAWCTQHLQGRTSDKLKEMNVGQRFQNRIMADVYGTKEGFLQEQGLADAEDPYNFEAKLTSLKETWDEMAPSFHDWFKRFQEETFKSCLVLRETNWVFSIGSTIMVWKTSTDNKRRKSKNW